MLHNFVCKLKAGGDGVFGCITTTGDGDDMLDCNDDDDKTMVAPGGARIPRAPEFQPRRFLVRPRSLRFGGGLCLHCDDDS